MDTRLTGTLSERLYLVLREKILAGEYPPGYHLKEVLIAKDFDTSPTPVREAIRRLTQEGLIQTHRYRGSVVTSYNIDDFLHLYQIREILELPAAQLAIRNANERDISELDGILAESERAMAQGDSSALLLLDLIFHETLVRSSGNPLLSDISRGIHEKLQTIRKITIPASIVGRQSHDEHRQIADDLKQRDLSAIQQDLTFHIRRNRDEVLAYLQEDGASPREDQPDQNRA
ncbi:MAG: GntR family transcriptional regulator [Thermaerobacter sp.]|nr:GntR family transcriptional regulator [Thermaerobacter sp.]